MALPGEIRSPLPYPALAALHQSTIGIEDENCLDEPGQVKHPLFEKVLSDLFGIMAIFFKTPVEFVQLLLGDGYFVGIGR